MNTRPPPLHPDPHIRHQSMVLNRLQLENNRYTMKEGDYLCIKGTSYEEEESYYEEDGSSGVKPCILKLLPLT